MNWANSSCIKRVAAFVCVVGLVSGTWWWVHRDTCTTVGAHADLFVATAFHVETDALRSRTLMQEHCKTGGVRYEMRTYEGIPFVLFETGVGPKQAGATTAQTLTFFSVTTLIMSGTAGSVDSALEVGEVTVPARWLDLVSGVVYEVDSQLLNLAQALPEIRAVSLGATSPVFIEDPGSVPREVSVVDMETAAMARISSKANVPFVALRAVSDTADGSATDNGFARAVSAAADSTLHLLERISVVSVDS